MSALSRSDREKLEETLERYRAEEHTDGDESHLETLFSEFVYGNDDVPRHGPALIDGDTITESTDEAAESFLAMANGAHIDEPDQAISALELLFALDDEGRLQWPLIEEEDDEDGGLEDEEEREDDGSEDNSGNNDEDI